MKISKTDTETIGFEAYFIIPDYDNKINPGKYDFLIDFYELE